MTETDGLLAAKKGADEDGFSALEFRDFEGGSSSAIEGRIASQPNQTPFRGDIESGGGGAPPQPTERETSGTVHSTNPLTFDYYRVFFDVDTDDIVGRLKRSVIPSQSKFLDEDQAPADLYGPFWICTTLIFVMAAAGNVGSFLSFVQTAEDKEWSYNFAKLTVASGVLYAYLGLVPLAGWLISKYVLSSPFRLIEMVCLYGYSFTIYLPTAIVCIWPSEFIRWVALLSAFGISSFFVVRNVRDTVMGGVSEPKHGLTILIAVLVLHFSLTIFLKFYFYN